MYHLAFQIGFVLLGAASIGAGVVLIVKGWGFLQLVFGA